MKRFKKIASILLAVVMVLAMAVPAMAAEDTSETKYTITIDNQATGHLYGAYQVFKGDYAELVKDRVTERILSNIDWGTGVDGTKLLAALQASESADFKDDNGNNFFKGKTTAREVAEVLDDYGRESTFAKAFADIVSTCLTEVYTESYYIPVTRYEIRDLAPGYYFVKDEKAIEGDDASTRYILEVVDDTEVKPKSDVPTSQKQVKEKNDTTGKETDWQDAADYDIGDEVPFQLTGTLPDEKEEFAAYESYYLAFHDKQSLGLTFDPKSVVVKVNGNKVTNTQETTYYEVVTENLEDGCTFEVIIKDAKKLPGAVAGAKITVEYTSTLNGEAVVIGKNGNPNEMYMEFSNNPYEDQHGKTPTDKVIVFTFELDADKVDGDTQPLEGAGFTLYKKVPDGTEGAEDGYIAVGNEVKGDKMTKFVFKGLDSGEYKLVETTTPPGYNTAADVIFKVEATYEGNSEDPQLTSLVIKDAGGNEISGTGDGMTFSVNIETGKIGTTVVNQKGSTLPGTGGMGTTLFYIIGGILVVGAVIVLVSKKRAAK